MLSAMPVCWLASTPKAPKEASCSLTVVSAVKGGGGGGGGGETAPPPVDGDGGGGGGEGGCRCSRASQMSGAPSSVREPLPTIMISLGGLLATTRTPTASLRKMFP